jgi:uncharacterized repeat protein (TIGR03803 family)
MRPVAVQSHNKCTRGFPVALVSCFLRKGQLTQEEVTMNWASTQPAEKHAENNFAVTLGFERRGPIGQKVATATRVLILAVLSLLPLIVAHPAHATNETVLYSFTGANGDGYYPASALIMDSAGNLYGTTVFGGANGDGTVFKLSPGGVETILHNFTGTNGDGNDPYGGLVMDGAGNLYGVTVLGGKNNTGTVFTISPLGREKVLYSFGKKKDDGASPNAALIMDSAGNFYGTTVGGGLNGCSLGCGTVFKVSPTGRETVLYRFGKTNNDGIWPDASLIMDSDGNLYGSTSKGGANDKGTIFKLSPDRVETVLDSFTGENGDGANPVAGLIMDSAGNLYGTTSNGGKSICDDGCGTVFKLSPSGAETILYSFRGRNRFGASPEGSLIMDSAGNLYGTTFNGGSKYCSEIGCGTVFSLSSNGGAETIIHRFTGYTKGDGSNPSGALLMDGAGNLYGTTQGGGATGGGSVFKIKPAQARAQNKVATPGSPAAVTSVLH